MGGSSHIAGFIADLYNDVEDSFAVSKIEAPGNRYRVGLFVGYYCGHAFRFNYLTHCLAVVSVNEGRDGRYNFQGDWGYGAKFGEGNSVASDQPGASSNTWSGLSAHSTAEFRSGSAYHFGYGDSYFQDAAFNDGFLSFTRTAVPLTANLSRFGHGSAYPSGSWAQDTWRMGGSENQGLPYLALDYSKAATHAHNGAHSSPLDVACLPGWSASSHCAEFSCSSNSDCSGHGACDSSSHQCQCLPSFGGLDCSASRCGSCRDGACSQALTNVFQCSCGAKAFSEGACVEVDNCAGGCGSGRCTPSGCTCDFGHEAADGRAPCAFKCQLFTYTDATCLTSNAVCMEDGVCGCPEKEQAFDAATANCTLSCPGIQHGLCTGLGGLHACDQGWKDGADAMCSYHDCANPPQGMAPCNATGATCAAGACVCAPKDYLTTAGTCQQGCPGIVHGHCVGENSAACDEGWGNSGGAFCCVYSCTSVNPGRPVCNELGTCSAGLGQCVCNTDSAPADGTCYRVCTSTVTTDCVSAPDCVPNDNAGPVCSAHGRCISSESGYHCFCGEWNAAGAHCESCADGYISHPGTSACVRDECASCQRGSCEFAQDGEALKRVCVCPSTHLLLDGDCFENVCGACENGNCSVSGDQYACACPAGAMLESGVCIYKDCAADSCRNGNCTLQEDYHETCVCPEGATHQAGSCVFKLCPRCDYGECTVQANFQEVCVCPQGAEDREGVCTTPYQGDCFGGHLSVAGGQESCVCDDESFSLDAQGYCVLDECPRCDGGECARDEDRHVRCHCPEGHQLFGGVCVLDLCGPCENGNCELAEGATARHCACPPGATFESGVCVYKECPACVGGACTVGEDYRETCVCTVSGFLPNAEGLCVMDVCGPCNGGTCALNGTSHLVCQCPAGHTLAEDYCVSDLCGPCENGRCDLTPGEHSRHCACPEGHSLISGKCAVPYSGSCEGGSLQVDASFAQTCVCPEDSALEADACLVNACGPCQNGQCLRNGTQLTKTCVCPDGHELQEGACIRDSCGKCENGDCTLKQYERVCECAEGLALRDSTCVHPLSGTCLNGQVLVDSEYREYCSCAEGHVLLSGVCYRDGCGACRGGSCSPVGAATQCVCPGDSVLEKETCVHKTCGACTGGSCVLNETYHETCVCAEGLVLSGQACISPDCGPCEGGACENDNQGHMVCRCPDSTELFEGVCAKNLCPSCTGGACALVGREWTCVCGEGKLLHEGACYPNACGACTNGECSLLAASQQFSCQCHAGAVILPEFPSQCVYLDSPQCENGAWAVDDRHHASCVCQEPYQLENGTCYQYASPTCADGQYALEDAYTYVCHCNPGFTQASSDRAVSQCVKSKKVPAATIAGAVVGGVVLCAAAALLAVYLIRRKRAAAPSLRLSAPSVDNEQETNIESNSNVVI